MRIIPKLTSRLPGSVTALLRLEPGERVIAWGSTHSADGTQTLFTVATDRALYVQAVDERIAWDHISKVIWNDPVLEVMRTDDQGRGLPALRVRVDDARDLPGAVHDRVRSSVLVSERVDLGGGAGALMVARRGSDDEVRWTVVFDSGLDPTDPALRTAAADALATLRGSLGI